MPEGVKSRGCYLWTCPGKCLFLELGLRRDLTEVKSGLVLFELDMVCAGWAIFVWYRRHCCMKWQLSGRRKGESFSVGPEWKVYLGGYHCDKLRKE